MFSTNIIIYFDNKATTPIDKRVLDAMLPFLTENFANPSSTHHFGISVNEAIKKAKIQIADLICAEQNEIIFTNGSTEAINFALKGVAENYFAKGKHIVTVSTEHHAVLDTCKHLESKGYEVTFIPVSKDGLIDLTELKNSLRADTTLVCLMYVNNETGVNVAGIVALAKKYEIEQEEMKQDAERISALRNELENELLKISGAFVNGSREKRIYNVSNICFPEVEANVLIGRMKNIAVSYGSACTAAVAEPSHVLLAMGASDDNAFASIRFSLGRFNTGSEVKTVIKSISALTQPNFKHA